jgi:hypothetical protein
MSEKSVFVVRQVMEFGASGVFMRDVGMFSTEAAAGDCIAELSKQMALFMGGSCIVANGGGQVNAGPVSQGVGALLGMSKCFYGKVEVLVQDGARIVVAGPKVPNLTLLRS